MDSLTDDFLSQSLITDEEKEDSFTIGQQDIRMLYEYGISYSDLEKYGDYDTATANTYKRNRRTVEGIRYLASKKYIYIFMSETKYLRLDKSIVIRLWLHLANASLTEQFGVPAELSINSSFIYKAEDLDCNNSLLEGDIIVFKHETKDEEKLSEVV